MAPISVIGDDLRTLLILLALLGLGMFGALLHTRHEWRALRHKMFRPVEVLEALTRPSRLAERLVADRWDPVFQETLSRSRIEFQPEGKSAAAMEAVQRNAGRLAPMVREVALRAMTEGESRSALVRLDEAIVYVMVFPGRHDDKRTFRRSEGLAQGWPQHARTVHDAAKGQKALPMLSLLYFLGLDAQSGTLLVAYEGEEGSLFPAELAEPANGPNHDAVRPGLSHDFVLV